MRFVILFFFLKTTKEKVTAGEITPPLNSVVLCASYRRNLTWHSQSSVNGTSASNLVTFSVWLQEVATVKILPLKKNKSPVNETEKVNLTDTFLSCHKTLANRRLRLQRVWQQKQYWNLKRGKKPPGSSIMSLSHFGLNLQRWKKALKW